LKFFEKKYLTSAESVDLAYQFTISISSSMEGTEPEPEPEPCFLGLAAFDAGC